MHTLDLDLDLYSRHNTDVESVRALTIYRATRHSNLPEEARQGEQTFALLSLKNICSSRRSVDVSPLIDVAVYNCLEPTEWLYEQIVDVYILGLLNLWNLKSATCMTCAEGEEIFYGDNGVDSLPSFKRYDTILMPILNEEHFTLAVIDTKGKTFLYLDSVVENEEETGTILFERFEEKTNVRDLTRIRRPHSCQHINDNSNCGVFVCEFAEAILLGRDLEEIESPDTYRSKIRNFLIDYCDDMSKLCLNCGVECKETGFLCSGPKCRRPVCLNCCEKYAKWMSINPPKCTVCNYPR